MVRVSMCALFLFLPLSGVYAEELTCSDSDQSGLDQTTLLQSRVKAEPIDIDYSNDPSLVEHGHAPQPQKLVNQGGSGCTGASPCSKCQGDCDRDSDCAVGLKCFRRSGFTPVPGCVSGGSGDKKDYDYCYKPSPTTLVNLGGSGCSGASPCSKCQGDCDKDSDCAVGLKCFQRSGFTPVPGCDKGGSGDKKGYDYCYKPSPTALVNLGGSGCTGASPCSKCQGDCDRDSDCAVGLKCFQRSGFTPVPGCDSGGPGDKKDYDYCYMPMPPT